MHIHSRVIGTIILLMLLFVFVFYLAYSQYSLNLARELIAIPVEASNLNAIYIGFGQGRTIYARFDLAAGSEDKFMAELCAEGYKDIDIQNNPFQDVIRQWWMPNWWSPPEDPETYLGGECNNYRILVDKTKETVYTSYIAVGI
jgi:hypothetical protein